jgi:hypothetical protein
MSAKVYFLKFGSGDPRPNTGLAPTFLQFYDSSGQTLAPPSITEVKYGGATASGVYGFSYLIGQSTINSIYFLAYSVTAVSSGITSDRYITGVLDPVLAIDQAIGISSINMGFTLIGIGSSLNSILPLNAAIGSTASSFGTQSSDPVTIFGFVKRIQELLEGDQVYQASGGTFLMYNRGAAGTTTLLRAKSLVNSGSAVTKSGD